MTAAPLVLMVPIFVTRAFPCIVSTPVPPDLVMVELLMIDGFPFHIDFRKILPVSDEVNAVLMVMAPPYIFIGPAEVIALSMVRFPVLLGFPNVKERMVCPF